MSKEKLKLLLALGILPKKFSFYKDSYEVIGFPEDDSSLITVKNLRSDYQFNKKLKEFLRDLKEKIILPRQ